MTSHNDLVILLGGSGMAGSAIYRKLKNNGFQNVLKPSRHELDLLDQKAVHQYFTQNPAHQVIMAAAKVGGILANMNDPTGFFLQNLRMTINVIEAADKASVPKLVYLGSSCVYPKMAPQPIKESSLLTGPLEPTNEGYALAKIAGIRLCNYYQRTSGRDYFSVMPTNLYGPGDNYHPTESHVLPALIRRIHEARVCGAKEVVIWGSGNPLREFMHVDDLADAIVHLLENGSHPELVNIGSGEEISIADLARLIAEITGFSGELRFDTSKPDGTPRKILDSSYLLSTGWSKKINLRAGIEQTYQDYLSGKGRNIRLSNA